MTKEIKTNKKEYQNSKGNSTNQFSIMQNEITYDDLLTIKVEKPTFCQYKYISYMYVYLYEKMHDTI